MKSRSLPIGRLFGIKVFIHLDLLDPDNLDFPDAL